MPFPDDPIRPKPHESSGLHPADSTQLSRDERVKGSVGTIALSPEGYRGVAGKVSGQNGAPNTASTRAASRPMSEMTDAEVMLLAGTGDDSAFGYLVEKFRRPIISFMYRMTHNQAIAEELAQEVFLRVYRSRSSYQA